MYIVCHKHDSVSLVYISIMFSSLTGMNCLEVEAALCGNACLTSRSIPIITPRACARGKAIGFVCPFVCLSVTTKIAGSGDQGIIARCKYHYSVGKVGKHTSFGLLGA